MPDDDMTEADLRSPRTEAKDYETLLAEKDAQIAALRDCVVDFYGAAAVRCCPQPVEVTAWNAEALSAAWHIHHSAITDTAAAADAYRARVRREALEEAADACAEYPRVAPDGTEADHYDEQIYHSQACIRALIEGYPS